MLMHSPFDILAGHYDADFTRSAIGQLQRKQVWQLLDQVLAVRTKPLEILEINCGTGEDALHIAGLGHSIIATDASEEMIEKAMQKAALRSDTATFLVCPFDNLQSCFPDKRFDLVVSDFGGLNCADEAALKKLGSELYTLLKPGGQLFLVVMGRNCLWEMLYFSWKGKLKSAFRRQRRSVMFEAGSASMPVFYYSPEELRKIFGRYYVPVQCRPIGLFVPPSYLEKPFSHRPNFLRWLGSLEQKWNKYPALSNMADHFCIIFKKREAV